MSQQPDKASHKASDRASDRASHTASDIARGNWVDRFAPAPARPYLKLARMERPIGTWLLLLPCWWGLALASGGWPDPYTMALFAVGALVMRGAGCTINDIADRDIDARVARTANRPIPAGDISVKQAIVFLIVQLLTGLLVLSQFNTFAIILAASSLGLVFFYPFAKRLTNWPQLVLGLAINWGALVGWAAVRGELGWAAAALYAGGVLWTLGYDTIYAYQDRRDDAKIGVKSTTFALGDRPKPWLYGFYALAALFIALGAHLAASPLWVQGGILLSALHLLWQVRTLDIADPGDCRAKFLSNRDFGLAVFMVIALGAVWG